MPHHTRRKLVESSVVRAAEEDASDDEAATINAPGGVWFPEMRLLSLVLVGLLPTWCFGRIGTCLSGLALAL